MARIIQALLAVAAVTLLFFAEKAEAVSYIGLGGGLSPSFGSEVRVFHNNAEFDTASFGVGYGLEAQFGWESAKYIDVEGALRYHSFSRKITIVEDLPQPSSYTIIGFEGGVRLHPERGFTNSAPYIRGGIGSYTPNIILDKGDISQSNDNGIGYYIGVGYTYEMSSKIGIDVRATMVTFNAFGGEHDFVGLRSRFFSILASVIVF